MNFSIRNKYMVTLVALLAIFGVLIVTIDPLINHFMFKEFVIKNHSNMFKFWKDPPIVPHLNIYLFNVTNHEDFLKNRSKPILNEVGPYCYKERWQKVNVSFHENGTVSYQTQRFYYFEKSLTNGSEDDIIITLNIPLMSAVNQMRYSYKFFRRVLADMFEEFNQEAFAVHTVRELIWGYEDPLLEKAKQFLEPEQLPNGNVFGFFTAKNGSYDGLLNIFTGKNGMDNYAVIDTFNHENKLSFWKSDSCNIIKGSDGSAFPPYITRNSTLHIFNENFCRSIPLNYVKDIMQYELKAYQFSPPEDVFDYNKDHNKCYCESVSGCTSRGLFNVSACRMGSPVILSWPHFYQADTKYIEAVKGLSPDPNKHAFIMNISPRTGSPFGAQARMQINIATVSDPLIKHVTNMTELIFPILWFEDGITELPDEIVYLFQLSEETPEIVKMCLKAVSLILGCITVFAIGIKVILQIKAIRQNIQTPCKGKITEKSKKQITGCDYQNAKWKKNLQTSEQL